MPDRTLDRCRILVVEDEYLLADELAMELADQGATVLGPTATVAGALALLDAQAPPHGAVLDVNLGGQSAFALADALVGRGVPVIFTTGYDATVFPDRFAHLPRCEKPIDVRRIIAALRGAIRR